MVTSALMFAGMSAAVKAAAQGLPNTVVVFVRNGVSLLLLGAWLAPAGPAGLLTRRLHSHWVRGFAGLAAMYLFFFAIARLPLADAVLLNYTLPPVNRPGIAEVGICECGGG
jgi:drug/metabolite transporter (DMT)-like permease